MRGVEVADRASEERDEPAAGARDRPEMAVEVADDRVHRDLVGRHDLGRRVPQRLFAHVEGHEPLQRSRAGHRVEQQPGLVRRARTELDQHVGPGELHDLGRVRAQDRALGSGRVVLGQSGDLVEQFAAAFVVEPHGRQRLRRGRQPRLRVGRHRGAPVIGRKMDVDGQRGFIGHETVPLGLTRRARAGHH